jgi:hypothetical protein
MTLQEVTTSAFFDELEKIGTLDKEAILGFGMGKTLKGLAAMTPGERMAGEAVSKARRLTPRPVAPAPTAQAGMGGHERLQSARSQMLQPLQIR